MAQEEDGRAKVVELIDRAKSALLTTTGPDGDLVSRPMGVQETEFDGDLWFFSDGDTDKVRQIRANPKVNVSFANESKSEWTSVTGTAAVVVDPAKAEQLWSKPLEAWFPQGLQTPGLTLIKVTAERAEFWDAATSRARQLIGMVKAIRNDDPDEFPVDNRTVELS